MLKEFSREDLVRLLPHAGIALVIDSLEFDPEETPHIIIAKKTLSVDDPYFAGHFPGNPIFPGHWSVEAMALAAAALTRLSLTKLQDVLPYFVGIEKFDFKRPIAPGDTIGIVVKYVDTDRRNIFTFVGEIVNQHGKVVATGTIRGTIVANRKEA